MCKKLLCSLLLAISLAGCVSTGPVVNNRSVTLNDEPGATFSTSGWSYTNTTNPFLLTPDYLTNAMIGVSRLKPGSPLLNSAPVVSVPDSLNMDNISSMLRKRLNKMEKLEIVTETIAGREVVVAKYTDEDKGCIEYAFPFKRHLVHILLRANKGRYFSSGDLVARQIVETIK